MLLSRGCQSMNDGAVTAGARATASRWSPALSDALATELVCVLRYKHFYYTAAGLQNSSIKDEF